ncbi:MAG: hypothetical protein MRJ93_03545 [Nitrososphaeraceae archaeon]|nr:hypothetical protein [Nitrososphaeraceae archaeon]
MDQTINQIAKQVANNPKGDLANAIGNLGALYGSGNSQQVNQAIKQAATQVAVAGGDVTQVINQIAVQINQYVENNFVTKVNYDIKDSHSKTVKRVVVKDKNTCPTQSDSIQLKGKLSARGVIVVADFEPCQLKDGRALLNLPNNPGLKFVILSLDKNGNDHQNAIVKLKKIQNLGKYNSLYTVAFDDKMNGFKIASGKPTTLSDINGLALYNISTKSVDFNPGNSLALTAVLKK